MPSTLFLERASWGEASRAASDGKLGGTCTLPIHGIVRNPLTRHSRGKVEMALEGNLFPNYPPSKDFHSCLFSSSQLLSVSMENIFVPYLFLSTEAVLIVKPKRDWTFCF